MFGAERAMRFRPSYFPFTEPSAEVDIWDEERQEWLEILGCGMVDPNVLDNVGYGSKIWHGYAFGMGVERIAMLNKGSFSNILKFYLSRQFVREMYAYLSKCAFVLRINLLNSTFKYT